MRLLLLLLLLWVGRRMVVWLTGRVGVAVEHMRGRGVRMLEMDWWIMALVDMVCVHDMDVACIARG